VRAAFLDRFDESELQTMARFWRRVEEQLPEA